MRTSRNEPVIPLKCGLQAATSSRVKIITANRPESSPMNGKRLRFGCNPSRQSAAPRHYLAVTISRSSAGVCRNSTYRASSLRLLAREGGQFPILLAQQRVQVAACPPNLSEFAEHGPAGQGRAYYPAYHGNCSDDGPDCRRGGQGAPGGGSATAAQGNQPGGDGRRPGSQGLRHPHNVGAGGTPHQGGSHTEGVPAHDGPGGAGRTSVKVVFGLRHGSFCNNQRDQRDLPSSSSLVRGGQVEAGRSGGTNSSWRQR